MKRSMSAGVGLLALMLSGCVILPGDTVGGGGASNRDERVEESPPLTEWAPEWMDEKPIEPVDAAVCETDRAGSSTFGCFAFRSTSGSTNGDDLPWLTTAPQVLMVTSSIDAGGFSMTTPCNQLFGNAVVDEQLGTIETDEIVGTLMGCGGPADESEAWTQEFLSRPMAYAVDDGELVLTSGPDELVFERVDRPEK